MVTKPASYLDAYASSLGTEIAIRLVREHGANPEPLLKSAGLDPFGRYGPGIKVAAQSQAQFYELASEATDNEYLGIEVARQSKFVELGPLIGLVLSASTFGDALQCLSDCLKLISNTDVLDLEHGHNTATVTATSPGETSTRYRQMEDCGAFFFLSLCKQLAGQEFAPLEVRLPYANPQGSQQHAILFGCAVTFGHTHNQTVLRRSDLDIRLRTADSALHATLATHCRTLLQGVDAFESEFVLRVKALIPQLLSKRQSSAERVADELGMSVRSLQRRLKAEGTSFLALRDTVRRELAQSHLANSQKSISQIAHLLDYSSPSSFNAAFKQMTGKTPGQIRHDALSN